MNIIKAYTVLLLVVSLLLPANARLGRSNQDDIRRKLLQGEEKAVIAGEYLVAFKPGTDVGRRVSEIAEHVVVEKHFEALSAVSISQVSEDALRQLLQSDDVLYIEPVSCRTSS